MPPRFPLRPSPLRPSPFRRRLPTRPLPTRSLLTRSLLALLGVTAAVLLPVTPAAAAPDAPAVLPAAIEAFSPYQGQTACDPVARPGVVRFRDLVLAAYPGTADAGIVRSCTSGGTSEHKEGRAWDWRVSASDPEQVAQVADLLDWLLAPDARGNSAAMARRLGVMYVIWEGRIWKSYQASRGWQLYSGANPHTDHVHLSFSWAGALAATSFWSGTVAPVMTRPIPPPTVSDTPTATIDVTPVADRRTLTERRRRAIQSLPGPWRRH